MSNKIFGPGKGYLRTTTGTPRKIADLVEVTIGQKEEHVQFYGDSTAPKMTAVTKTEVTGTCKVFGLNARNLAAFVAGTRALGSKRIKSDEPLTIPDSPGPYTLTVSKSATWTEDLGVRNASTGAEMDLVTGTPATGEYSVATGVYTFAAADKTIAVLISYVYTDAVNGEKVTKSNATSAVAPTFELAACNNIDGEVTIVCPAVIFSGLEPLYAGKMKAFTEEFSAAFTLQENASGTLYELSTVPAGV